MLVLKIDEQQKEIKKLQAKLDKIIKTIDDKKNKIKEKDEENKILVKQLQQLKVKYERVPQNKNEKIFGDNEKNNEHFEEED